MKKVFVQKIPLLQGKYQNNMAISYEIANNFHNMVYGELKNDYHVITTPMECSIIDENEKIFCVDGSNYSLSEINEIIEKAKIYDSEHQ